MDRSEGVLRVAELALAEARRALKAVAEVRLIEGPPGRDGFGFDDLEVIHDGERAFKFVFTRGDAVKEFAFTLPVVLDRGVYKDDAEYEAGDCVSSGGSLWIAQGTTKERPGTSEAWRLSVKKGRDGRDGELKAPAERKPVKL